MPPKIGGANRRLGFLIKARRGFGRAFHAPPSLSAAVAHLALCALRSSITLARASSPKPSCLRDE